MESKSDMTKAAKLQDKLKSTYDHLKSIKGLSGRMEGTDITDAISDCINTSMSFRSAEEVLKDAGFEINHPDLVNGPNNVNRAADWYAVVASIRSYASQNFGRSSIFVTLLPASPGRYEKIERVTAKIFTTFL